jgi:hypothetical protein
MKKNENVETVSAVEKVKSNTPSEADALWDQIKKTPVSMFGMAPNPLETLVTRINVAPDKLHLSVKGPSALISFVEDALNVKRNAHGAEVRVNSFEVESTNNGMLVISKAAIK